MEVLGVASGDASALRHSPGQPALPGARYAQPLTRAATSSRRDRLQLHRPPDSAAAALRRTLYFRAASGDSAGLFPLPFSSIQAFALGLPARYFQGYGDSRGPTLPGPVAVRAGRLAPWSDLTLKLGVRYQKQFWPDLATTGPGFPGRHSPETATTSPRGSASRGILWRQRTSVHGAYGLFFDNLVTGAVAVDQDINGRDESDVRTLIARVGRRSRPARPPDGCGRPIPEPEIPWTPDIRRRFAHPSPGWIGSCRARISFVRERSFT